MKLSRDVGRERLTGRDPAECALCEGYGTTPETAAVTTLTDAGLRTVKLGSGCPTCHGTGRLPEPAGVRSP